MIPAALCLSLFAAAPAQAAGPSVVAAADVVWEDLNPARGDQSPRAGTLWGDRDDAVATGFLLAPVDGFESPPHIHNVTYRGVVLRGALHNDDPDAARMWLPPGSFWTQPAGESHITAAQGSDVLAYIEIDQGPYLVRPADQAHDTGERPVQLHPTNLVWVAPPGSGASGEASPPARVSYLWGDPTGPGPSGVFVRVPAGAAATVSAPGALHAVVVQGAVASGGGAGAALAVGSLLSVSGGEPLPLSCRAATDCTVYIRAEGALDFPGG